MICECVIELITIYHHLRHCQKHNQQTQMYEIKCAHTIRQIAEVHGWQSIMKTTDQRGTN